MTSGSSGEDAVCVAVHMRPLVAKELEEGCQPCLVVTPGQPQVGQGLHMFTYDHVFGEGGEAPEQLYDTCVAPLVDGLFKGYNATVFAYGQTGSGKTYTMGSAFTPGGPTRGVIPRVMEAIFQRVAAAQGTDFTVRVGFVEIHREEIKDLLVADPRHPPIHIREVGGGICLAGATETEVRTREEMVRILEQGSLLRATAATGMNRQSSRSHAIFTITLEQRRLAGAGAEGGSPLGTARQRRGSSKAGRGNEGGEEEEEEEDSDGEEESGGEEELADDSYLCAKMHLVDLAGSERAKRTKAVGARLKEGININRGLLALGNVICALSESKPHVPYRDSKLTRMLQDSLGGNSRTLMVACVSPADSNLEESLNTLRYAARARAIKNKPVVNRDPVAAAIAQLRSQLAAARAENSSLKRKLAEGGDNAPTGDSEVMQAALDELDDLRRRVRSLEREKNVALVERDRARGEAADATRRMVAAQTAAARLQQRLAQADPAAAAEDRGQLSVQLGVEEGVDVIEAQQMRIAELEREVKRVRQVSRVSGVLAISSRRTSLGPSDQLPPGSPLGGSAYSPFRTGLSGLGTGEPGSPRLSEDALSEYEDLAAAEQHRAGMADLESKMAALEQELQAKQAALGAASQHSMLRQAYDRQLRELQHERDQLESERASLTGQLRALQAASEEERLKLEVRYKARIKEIEEKVTLNKAKERKLAELERYKQRAEDTCKRLEADIQSIKHQKVALSRQMERQGREFAEWRREREREVAALRKQGRANAAQLQKMEALHAKQQAVLRRKTEEAEAARRRLKGLEERRTRAAAVAAAAARERGGGTSVPGEPRPVTAPVPGSARQAAASQANAERQMSGGGAPTAAAEVEVQPNPAAPLLRDERARARWVEHELEACCASYELQKVLEGEKAQRAEAYKQLQAAERRLAALRNPDWWPAAAGGAGSPSQNSEDRLVQRRAQLQDEVASRSQAITDLQLQLMKAKQSEEERGGGAADARRWVSLRSVVEARALLKTVFRSASQHKAQAYEAHLQLSETQDALDMERLKCQVAVAEKLEVEKQLAETQSLLLAGETASAPGGADTTTPQPASTQHQDAAAEVLQIMHAYDRLRAAPTPAASPTKESEVGPLAATLLPAEEAQDQHQISEGEEEDSESEYSSSSSDEEGDEWNESMLTPANGGRRRHAVVPGGTAVAGGQERTRRRRGSSSSSGAGSFMPPEEAPVLLEVNAERGRAGLPPVGKLTVSVLREHLRGKMVGGRPWVAGKKKREDLLRECRQLMGLPDTAAAAAVGSAAAGGAAAGASGDAAGAGAAGHQTSRFLAHTVSSKARARAPPHGSSSSSSGQAGIAVAPAPASAEGCSAFGSPVQPEQAPHSSGSAAAVAGVTPLGAQGQTPEPPGVQPGPAAAAAVLARATDPGSPSSSGGGLGGLLRRSFSLRPFSSPRSFPVQPSARGQQDEQEGWGSPRHSLGSPRQPELAMQQQQQQQARLGEVVEGVSAMNLGPASASSSAAAAATAALGGSPSSAHGSDSKPSPASRLARLLRLRSSSNASDHAPSPSAAAAPVPVLPATSPRQRLLSMTEAAMTAAAAGRLHGSLDHAAARSGGAPAGAQLTSSATPDLQRLAMPPHALRSSNGGHSAGGDSACQSREGSRGADGGAEDGSKGYETAEGENSSLPLEPLAPSRDGRSPASAAAMGNAALGSDAATKAAAVATGLRPRSAVGHRPQMSPRKQAWKPL